MRFDLRSLVLPAVVVIAGLSPASLTAQCNQNCPEKRAITVTATASVTVDADLAIVHVGYKLYAPDSKTAYDHAASISNAIVNSLTALGIPKTSIESTSQLLQHTQPYELNQYPMDSVQREQHEFVASQEWTVRVKPDEAAKALDAAITAGANESGWIEWVVQDETRAQAEASAKAMANARTIAGQIAQTAGVHLGALISANENQQNMPMAGPRMMAMGNLGGGIQRDEQLAINSRRVQFKASIFASFAIE